MNNFIIQNVTAGLRRVIGPALALGLCFFLCPGLGVGVSRAQAPAFSQIDQTERAREANQMAGEAVGTEEKAPELFEGESSDLGPQNVLQIQKRPQYFQFVADSQIYHTDNFFLANSNQKDAVAWVNTLATSFIPKSYDVRTGKLTPRIGFRQQWYNFGVFGPGSGLGVDFDTFDFAEQTGYLDGTYGFGDGWTAELGLDYGRIYSQSGGAELYKELAPRWRLQKRFELTTTSQIALGYEGIYHDSRVGFILPPTSGLADRLDSSFFAAATAVWRERFVGQAFYRYRYTDLQDSGRSDNLHTVGASLYYFFTNRLSLRTYLTYDSRNSRGTPVPDFNRLNAGVGVNFTLPF